MDFLNTQTPLWSNSTKAFWNKAFGQSYYAKWTKLASNKAPKGNNRRRENILASSVWSQYRFSVRGNIRCLCLKSTSSDVFFPLLKSIKVFPLTCRSIIIHFIFIYYIFFYFQLINRIYLTPVHLRSNSRWLWSDNRNYCVVLTTAKNGGSDIRGKWILYQIQLKYQGIACRARKAG